ncbi:TPA: FRG domain-containing protein, partial [Staphylococcus aureus]
PKIEEKNENLYKIEGINCKVFSEKNKKLKKLSDKISNLNDRLDKYSFNGSSNWKLFYVYKELIQIFEEVFDDSYTKNYFRGQAHDWQMKAGLFREDVIDDFKKEFETIYEDIAYKYPETILHVDINNNEKLNYDKDFKIRENDMAYLQHYGLRTTLIDITENPFIGLLFLTSDVNQFENATFDMYNVNIQNHTSKNLFSRVKMLNRNKRIIAQKGAFFNFEKLLLLLNDNGKSVENKIVDRIPLLRVKLSYEFDHINQLNQKIEEKNKQIPSLRMKYNKLSEVIKDKNSILEQKFEYLEKENLDINHNEKNFSEVLTQIRELFNELNKMNDEMNKYNDKIDELKKEIQEIDIKIKREKNSIKNYLYPSICKELKEKLSQYHYVENELFPDIYKHIGYIQNSFLSNNDSIKMDENEINIMNLLEKK